MALPWWSPWNEPNDARFLSPQRETCGAGAVPAATVLYSQLARAMSSELKALAPGDRMLLGELGGYASGSAAPAQHRRVRGSAARGRALPRSAPGRCTPTPPAAAAKPRPIPWRRSRYALAARGGCAASAPVWVTESGAGAPDPGHPRRGGPREEHAACRALAAQVLRWRADPRVEAILQYEFRDDPAFPTGLLSADLTRLRSGYGMWLAVLRSSRGGARVSAPDAVCTG